MSEAFNLDLQEQIARINNQQEEARKFAAEQHKLAAEAGKLERDRGCAVARHCGADGWRAWGGNVRGASVRALNRRIRREERE